MTAQLDCVRAGRGQRGADPTFPTVADRRRADHLRRVDLGRGLSSVLEADYYWMYDDGWGGSSTTNSACSLVTPVGCWGHRDIILHEFANCPTGPPVLSMGAAFSPTGYSGGSIAAIVRQLVRAARPTSRDRGARCRRRSVGLADGRHRAAAQRHRLLGGRGQRHGRGLRLGAERRLAQRPAQRAHRRHGGDARRRRLLAGGRRRRHLQLRRRRTSTGRRARLRLNKPIVGMASTPDGKGYWMVASDGGIFSFGDAAFYGSMGGTAAQPTHRGHRGRPGDRRLLGGGVRRRHLQLRRPVLREHRQHPAQPAHRRHGGVAPTARATASWPSDGGIFTFGNAPFDGSTGGTPLVAPVVGMAPDNATNGYWMAAADGGIFTFGGASFLGRRSVGG